MSMIVEKYVSTKVLAFINTQIGLYLLGQTVGWLLFVSAKVRREESPGSTETRCRVTPGEGDLRESATESKPPALFCRGWVRVKGCGKSAPRTWRQGRHGKPHREQNRIGMAGKL